MTEKRIRHRIERHEKKLKRLEAIGSNLSKAGCWSKGYEDGVLSVLYELLDEIEDEAIKRIQDHMEIHRLKEQRAIYLTDAFDMAITALKEIQQYREIGTVEEFRKLKERSIDNE